MLRLSPRTAALRKVSVRSADRDALRVRLQLERALAAVDWMPPGLPPGAILLVRRLAPPPAEAGAARVPFGERVSQALRDQASRARRPWLQAGMLEADAVVFVDEAELMACLARDWLRGHVAGRWWWRSVLLDADPFAWLRREALMHPEAFMPAASLLAARGEASELIARFDAPDCERLSAAIARVHAVVLDPPTPPPRQLAAGGPDETHAPAFVAPTPKDAASAARLLAVVPELRTTLMAAAQRRLLALVLTLIRAPTWTRTPSFSTALASFDAEAREVPTPTATPPPSDRSREQVPRAPLRAAPSSVELVEHAQATGEVHAVADPPPPQAPDATPTLRVIAAATSPVVEAYPTAKEARPDADPASAAASEISDRPALLTFEATPEAEIFPARLHAVIPVEATPRASPSFALHSIPRIPTRYGGLFYLLNAAIAMGLYSDFTAPRGPNLELSPWDWLAIVGREWFGRDFAEDRLWNLLAELAGRTEFEAPEREFEPPHADWLAEHLDALRRRLALAVDAREEDVAAFCCLHDGEIEVTPTTVHVHLALAGLGLAIRVAGLDRDTGWIPAAGRAVRFHFD